MKVIGCASVAVLNGMFTLLQIDDTAPDCNWLHGTDVLIAQAASQLLLLMDAK